MKIYFNGDSNVAGIDLPDPATQGFAAKLANKLGSDTIINEAFSGASNQSIMRNTHAYLRQCKESNSYPDLVVIGWSDNSREDWFVDGKYVCMSGMSPEKQAINPGHFEYWQKHCEANFIYLHNVSKFFNREIHNLHQELKFLKIPHLFFNAIYPLNLVELTEDADSFTKRDVILQMDWDDCYFRPYGINASWRFWAIENNYKELVPGLFHYEESCQEAWAQLVYDHIKEKNIV